MPVSCIPKKTSSNITRSDSAAKQNTMNDFDPVSNLERLKISTLKKAVALKHSVNEVTIGPSSRQNIDKDHEESSNGLFATSTPINGGHSIDGKKKLHPHKLNFESTSSSISNASNFESEESIPHNFLIKVYEQQLRETVKKAMEPRLAKLKEMDRKSKAEIEALKNAMKMEAMSKAAAEHEFLRKELEEEEKTAAINMEKLAARNEIHAKRLMAVNEKVKELEKKELEEQERKREKWKERKQFLDTIFAKQVQFRQKYQELSELIRTCDTSKELMDVISSDFHKARFSADSVDELVEKCRDGGVEAEDGDMLLSLTDYINQLNDIYENVKLKAEKFKAEKLAAHAISESVENNAATLIETSNKGSISAKSLEYVDIRCLKNYEDLKKNLESVETSLEPFHKDANLKQFRFLCQKAIIIPVNAISPVGRAHLVDKYDKLSNLLAGKSVIVNNKPFCATGHPLGVQFCKYTLAKKFVEQGERNVSSHPEAAFAIASIIVVLWAEYPDFGQLLLAFFHRVNPYLIPACWPQTEKQSNQDYYKSLGYEYSEDGEVEKQDKYLKRLSGVVRLYAAIIITKMRSPNVVHPYGLSQGWRWMAAILNLDPVPDVTATFLLDFLEVAGSEMARYYHKQFQKLLVFICKEYFTLIEQVTPGVGGAPLNRLKEMLSLTLKRKTIPPPKGLLPPNFW